MLQMEMFRHFTKDWEYVGGGCFCRVYAKPDSEWVWKLAYNDTTRNYLEWCVLKTQRGERMLHMPEIDFLTSVGEKRYLVAMRRYQKVELEDLSLEWNHWDGSPRDVKQHAPESFIQLIEAFEEETRCPCNDIHHANIMRSGSEIILTDPCAGGYYSNGYRLPWGATHELKMV